MSCQLSGSVQGDEHCDVYQRTPLFLQARACPDGTPAGLSNKLLHWPCKLRAILQGLLDIFGTIDLRAEFQTFVEEGLVGCGDFVIGWWVVGGGTHVGGICCGTILKLICSRFIYTNGNIEMTELEASDGI